MKINCILVTAGITFAILMNSFAPKSSKKDYGFLFATKKSDLLYHYTVVDLAILDSLNIDYSCDLDKVKTYCQISLFIDSADITRNGPNNEIIEFDHNPEKIEGSGEGFHFDFERN